jgi:hypothetical protein
MNVRSRMRVEISRRRRAGPAARWTGRGHAGTSWRTLPLHRVGDGLAEQLDERGLAPGEVGDPPGAQRRGEHRLVVGAVAELEQGVAGLLGHDAHARDGGGPAGPRVGYDDPQHPARLAAAQLLHGPGGDHAAAGEDADGVAQPLDEVELVAGEHDRHPGAALLEQRLGQRVDTDRVQAR